MNRIAIFLLLAGCSSAENTGSLSQALPAPPPAFASCHVHETGVINGTMTTDGRCCGVSLCNDAQNCGTDYGKYTKTCSSCSYYACENGATVPAPPTATFRF